MKKIKIFLCILLIGLGIACVTYFYSTKVNSVKDSVVSYPDEIVNENIEAQPLEEIKPEIVQAQQIDTSIRMLMLGDTGLLEPLGSRVQSDSTYDPFMYVKEFFKKYDYIVATLEATIDGASVGQPNPGKAYTFSTPKESINTFKNAGITAFSYAGNHTKDYGPESVIHTIELLNSVGIGAFGAGANNDQAYTPMVATIKDTKIAFLGFNCMEYDFNHSTETEPGTASFSEWRVQAAIENARNMADVVVVFAHWGEEHTQELDPVWQVQWADKFTRFGADIVIGGHPHVIQQNTLVNGKPVYYSIGNFMYPGQGGDPNSLKGLGVEIVINDKKITETIGHEFKLDNDGIPRI